MAMVPLEKFSNWISMYNAPIDTHFRTKCGSKHALLVTNVKRTLSSLNQRPPFLKVKAHFEPIFEFKDCLLNGTNTLLKMYVNLFCSLPK